MKIYYYDSEGKYTGSGSSHSVVENSTKIAPENLTDIFIDGVWIAVSEDFRTEESRVSSIKAKAGEIITSRYNIIKQMNIYGEGGEAQLEMTTWIKKIRDISNKAEADGTALADIIWE